MVGVSVSGLSLREKRVHKPFNRKIDGQVGHQKQRGFFLDRPANVKATQLSELEDENCAPPEEGGGAAYVGLNKNDGGLGVSPSSKENHILVKQPPVFKYRPPLVRPSAQVESTVPNTIKSSPVQKPCKTCKVLIVGHPKCGKSSIIRRFVENNFEPRYCTTIGADYMRKDVTTPSGNCIRIQLWDIAGQERFAKLTRSYYRRAQGAIVVCDLARPTTIDTVKDWKKELEDHCGRIPIFLVGNKLDLLELDVPVSANEKLEILSQDLGFDKYYTTSAKDGLNIDEALNDLLEHILMQSNSVDTVKSDSVDNSAFKLSTLHSPNRGGGNANENMPCCVG